jgi:hypothetical protein
MDLQAPEISCFTYTPSTDTSNLNQKQSNMIQKISKFKEAAIKQKRKITIFTLNFTIKYYNDADGADLTHTHTHTRVCSSTV